VLQEWITDLEKSAHAALEQVEELAKVPRQLQTVVGHGESWEEAVDDVGWDDDDVLVVGSSAVGPIAQVFLGSRGPKSCAAHPFGGGLCRVGRRKDSLAGEPRPIHS